MGNAFWWRRIAYGDYAIGLGELEIITVTAPDDALGAQWAQCCANALNQRERVLRDFGIDTVYNADGTVNEARSQAAQLARDKWEANADRD